METHKLNDTLEQIILLDQIMTNKSPKKTLKGKMKPNIRKKWQIVNK